MRKVLLTTASGVALLFGASAMAQVEAPGQIHGTFDVAQMERQQTPETAPGAGAIEREREAPGAAGTQAAPGEQTFLSFEQNEELFAGKTVGDMPAEEWIGRNVVDQQGETIGSVEDLLIQERDQEITHALVEVGGFLGIGATRVALDIDELQPAEGAEGDAVTNVTREQLEAMPHLERTNGSWVPSDAQR